MISTFGFGPNAARRNGVPPIGSSNTALPATVSLPGGGASSSWGNPGVDRRSVIDQGLDQGRHAGPHRAMERGNLGIVRQIRVGPRAEQHLSELFIPGTREVRPSLLGCAEHRHLRGVTPADLDRERQRRHPFECLDVRLEVVIDQPERHRRVRISAGPQQQLGGLQVGLLHGEVQRRRSGVRRGPRIRSRADQRSGNGQMLPGNCPHQCGLTLPRFARADVSTASQK